MTLVLNAVPAGTTLYIPFASYNAAGASVTLTGLAVTDIEIYKNGSVTQRASDNGYALLDTDGIDFDGVTGLHGFSIDLSDNSDSGFYAVGSWYWVVVSTVTVDSQTVTFIAAVFRVVAAEATAGYPVVTGKSGTGTGEWSLTSGVIAANVTQYGGSNGTFSGGRPEVNTTHAAGTAWGSGAITAAAIATDAIDADALKADAITEIQSGLATQASVDVIDGIVDDILLDTAEIGAAGAGLTTLATAANLATVSTNVSALLTRITSTLFTGITSLAEWLGLIAGKQTGNTTARNELRATGAGSGTYDETTDSTQAIRDRGDAAWITATGFSTHSAADVWAVGTRALTDKAGFSLTQTFPTNFADLAITASTGRVTAGTVTDKTGYSLSQSFPSNFAALGINASGHVSRVTLVDTTTTNTDMRGTDGANTTAPDNTSITAIKAKTDQFVFTVTNRVDSTTQAGVSTLTQAQSKTAAAEALADIHLDRLLAADYDPANKPGTATALLNELVESDAGVSQFTANALELAPTGGSAPTAVQIRQEMDANSTQLAAIVEDTGTTLPATLATIAAYVDTEVAAIKAKTDLIPASPAAVGDIPTVSQIWTTALTEAYKTAGSTGTAAQLLYEILANLTDFSISGTTKTARKLDGTTAKTYTLNDATSPTAITEAT
jgi:hypothetical protein